MIAFFTKRFSMASYFSHQEKQWFKQGWRQVYTGARSRAYQAFACRAKECTVHQSDLLVTQTTVPGRDDLFFIGLRLDLACFDPHHNFDHISLSYYATADGAARVQKLMADRISTVSTFACRFVPYGKGYGIELEPSGQSSCLYRFCNLLRAVSHRGSEYTVEQWTRDALHASNVKIWRHVFRDQGEELDRSWVRSRKPSLEDRIG